MMDRFGRGLFVSTAIVAMAAATPAMAQTRNFNVPAQAAETGISAFGRQAEIQIVAARKFTKGKKTNAVRGEMTVEAALRQLLEGTGLTFRATGAQTYMVVQAGNGQSGASDAAGKAEISGTVTDSATGRRLVGALVRLAPSGQTAVTDEQGNYRITGVPAGDVAVSVSFLGLTTQQQDVAVGGGEGIDVDFAMGVGDDIVVYGTKSARALALNRERTAENSSTVISSDLLGNFQGTTISDALRRAPGVSFEQDPKTGDGTNIIVRGLAPDYNQVKLNGVALSDPYGSGRATSLGNVLASSVSEITISKTLLPSQDSAGTGGLVEIETKSPLDRPRRSFSLGADGIVRAKGFGKDYLLSGLASARFGADDNFGISASVQYRNQDVTSYGYDLQAFAGPYLPLGPNGQPLNLADIDPRTRFPFEPGVDQYYPYVVSGNISRIRAKTLTLSAAAEWKVSNATNLKFDYVRSDRHSTDDQSGFGLNQYLLGYRLRSVPEIAENRYAISDPNGTLGFSRRFIYYETENQLDTYSARAKSKAGNFEFNANAGISIGRAASPKLYQLIFSDQTFSARTPGYALAEAFNADGSLGSIFGTRAGSGFPIPLLTEQGFAAANSGSNGALSYGSLSSTRGRSTNFVGGGNIRYTFDKGPIAYLEAGVEYKRSKFSTRSGTATTIFAYSPFTAADGNIGIIDFPLSRVSGSNFGFTTFDPASALALVERLPSLAGNGVIDAIAVEPDPLFAQSYTKERDLVGYLQANLKFGRLEVVGGVRMSRVTVRSADPNAVTYYDENFVRDDVLYNATRVLILSNATQTAFLPRILANWRIQDDFILRAGYFKSVARPQVGLLSAEKSFFYSAAPFNGPNFDQPGLNISMGNPDLKSASTDNFDVSAEFYQRQVGMIKVSAFYKAISNLLETNRTSISNSLEGVNLPDDPRFQPQNFPSNLYIEFTKPVNNPDVAHLWGGEISVERQLDFLPGLLSGLGIYSNYTYADSSKNQPAVWETKPIYDANGAIIGRELENFVYEDVPFSGQPKHSGTLGLTYAKYGIEAQAYYTFQSARRTAFERFGLDRYQGKTSSLDIRIAYNFKLGGADARAYVQGNDLLKGRGDPVSQQSIGDNFNVTGWYTGGRRIETGVSLTF